MENKQTQTGGEYEEIDLREIVETLLKRKRLIFGIVIVFVVIAIFIGLRTPKIYRVDSVIEIGMMAGLTAKDDAIYYLPIESPLEAKEKTDRDIYGAVARDKLGYQTMPAIKVANTVGTDIIYLSIESTDSKKANDYLVAVGDQIVSEHKRKSESQQAMLKLLKISDTSVIKSPVTIPLANSKFFFNVIIAIILGLLLGTFLALAIDWWYKSKK